MRDERQAQRELIRQLIRPSQILGRHTELKASSKGRFKGRCPLHDDRSPSLSIDDEKGVWHCHGCKAGGDIFNAVMQLEHTSFTGALRFLADELGIRLKETLQQRPSMISDRFSGKGTWDNTPVHFALSPSGEITGSLEYSREEDGLVYGPQMWDSELRRKCSTSPSHRKALDPCSERAAIIHSIWPEGTQWKEQDGELHEGPLMGKVMEAASQVREMCQRGLPALMLIGKDGASQAQLIERWGIRELVCTPQSRKDLNPAILKIAPLYLTPLESHQEIEDRSSWTDTQQQWARDILRPALQYPTDASRLAKCLEQARRVAHDRDLFHHCPIRAQEALQHLLPGLSPKIIESEMRESNPIDTGMLARELGLPRSGSPDLILAASLWKLAEQWQPGKVASRVRELQGTRHLPPRSEQVVKCLERNPAIRSGLNHKAQRELELGNLASPEVIGQQITRLIDNCAGKPLQQSAPKSHK